MTDEKDRDIRIAQEQIVEKLMTGSQVKYLLSDHITGQFVVRNVNIDPDDIGVDPEKITFSFENLCVCFSGEKDGTGINNLTVEGEGKFEWSGGKVTEIYELEISDNLAGNIGVAQEQIAEKLKYDADVVYRLSGHIPGHIVDDDVNIDPDDIVVNPENMTFSFKNLCVSFSGEQDGMGIDNNLTTGGEGEFKWLGGKVIEIYGLKFNDVSDDKIELKYDRD